MTEQESTPLLKGQIALVTGATGGIGKATSRLLASLGCSVALHYNSDENAASTLRDELTKKYANDFGTKFEFFKADLGQYEDVRLSLHVLTCNTIVT